MAWITRSSRLTILALALTLSPALHVLAQPSQSGSSSFSSRLENSFRPPARGIPDNRQGGATRGGSCFVKDNPTLTPLVPIPGGETAAEYPTVFWYMPRMTDIKEGESGLAPAPAIQFTLRDSKNEKIYSAQYPIPKYGDGSVGTPGIMSLTLAKPLKVGQKYQWQIEVTCDAKDPNGPQYQSALGVLNRVAEDPNLQQRVQQATPEDRVILYAQANLWYELLANMVALRRDRPNDPTLKDAWNKLLAAVELETVTIQSRSQGARNTNNSN